MNTISCYDSRGNLVPVPAERVAFRPAVYGVFIEDDQVLLLWQEASEQWHLPGQILATQDTHIQGLLRHFRQWTGVTMKVGSLLLIEDQYRIDGKEQAWHLSALYYALTRPLAAPITLADPQDGLAPEFIPLDVVRRRDLLFGYEAIQAARLQQTT